MQKKDKKEIKKGIDKFLNDVDKECQGEECVIKGDKSLVERINKKIVIDDGRELLL